MDDSDPQIDIDHDGGIALDPDSEDPWIADDAH